MIVMVRLSLILATLLPLTAVGWNDSGHMITAIIAYQQMTEEHRSAVVERLKEHKRYREDFKDLMPLDVPRVEEDMWIFAKAATWPDTTRHFRHVGVGRDDLVLEFNYEDWHYAHLPIVLGKKEPVLPNAGASLRTQSLPEGNLTRMNALQALARAIQMQSKAISGSEKAISLTWILHLVGDIHQPLHSASLFDPTVLPEGDRGGKRLMAYARTLHDLWDSALDSGTTWLALKAQADELMVSYAIELDTVLATMDPNAWNFESHALARSMVYTPNVLGAVQRYSSPQSEVAVFISEGYVRNMTDTAHKRVSHAGFRLARMLENLNSDSKESPD